MLRLTRHLSAGVLALTVPLVADAALAHGGRVPSARAVVAAKPVAVIDGRQNGETVVSGPEQVAFSALRSVSQPPGRPLTYTWSFSDDGSTLSGPRVSHNFVRKGDYTVTLIVADAGVASDPFVVHYSIRGVPPTAVIDQADGTPAASIGQPVTLSATKSHSNPAGHALVYDWRFSDGGRGQGVSVTHVFTALGPATVTLGVVDAGFGVSASPVTLALNVRPGAPAAGEAAPVNARPLQAAAAAPRAAPVARIKAPTGVLADSLATFDGSGSTSTPAGHALTYAWKFSDGITATGAVVRRKFSGNQEATVTLIVTDGTLASEPVTALFRVATPTARRP